MRQRREAIHGTKAERGLRGRVGVAVAIASLLALGITQAALANSSGGKITSVTPNHGCPGETVAIVGSSLSSSEQLTWTDPTAQFVTSVTTPLHATSATNATATVPLLVAMFLAASRLRVEPAHAAPDGHAGRIADGG